MIARATIMVEVEIAAKESIIIYIFKQKSIIDILDVF